MGRGRGRRRTLEVAVGDTSGRTAPCLDCPAPIAGSTNDGAGREHQDAHEVVVAVDVDRQPGADEGGEGPVVNVGCNLDLRLEAGREHKAGCSKRDCSVALLALAAAAAAAVVDEVDEAER